MTMSHSNNNLLGICAAAEYLGISHATLKRMVDKGVGPVYYKIGSRLKRFKPTDLDAWMDSQAVKPDEYGETT